jgi:DNA-binding SARP family transcriptional activator/TolB-like protein/Tfp pilus assembly protein PilF
LFVVPCAASGDDWDERLQMQRTKRLSLRLLGGCELVASGDPPKKLRIASRKGRALIAYLALQPDHYVSREQAATLLWGDRYDVQARQDLRQCLVSLRRALASTAPQLLVVDNVNIGLRVEDLTIDALEFTTLAAVQTPDFGRAAELYRGQFLTGIDLEEPFAEWLATTRFRFGTIAAGIFETCAKYADREGNGKQAIDAAERLVEIDPTREDWLRLALEFYARYRGRETALTHANQMIARLKRELGADVEPATKALLDDIQRGAIPVCVPADCVLSSPDTLRSLRPEAVINEDVVRAHLSAPQAIASRAPSQASASIPVQLWMSQGGRKSIVLVLSAIPAALLLFAVFGQLDKRTRAVSEPISYTIQSPLGRGTTSNYRRSRTGVAIPVMVLPFLAESDPDARNQISAIAIADDLTNVLKQNSELEVISPRAPATYEEQAAEPAAFRTPIGAYYIIDGAVRSEGPQLHVNVALVDAISGLQVWSDQFVQESAAAIVARLTRELQFAVTLAQSRNGIQSSARESEVGSLIFEGLAALLRDSSRENTEKEVELFEQALQRRPDLPAAQLGLAMALVRATLNSLVEDDPQQSLDRAEALLNKVLQEEPTSYRALYWQGLLHKARGNLGGGATHYHLALTALKRALELNPSASYIHGQVGAVLVSLGRPKEGLNEIQYAINLNPKDPSIGHFYLFAGKAELELGHDGQAIEWLTRAATSVPRNPSAYRLLSATYALIGDHVNMQKYSAEFRKLVTGTAYQDFVDQLKSRAVGHRSASRSRISEGLRIAFAP